MGAPGVGGRQGNVAQLATDMGAHAAQARLGLTWPVAVLFAGFPVWWALGLSSFIWLPVGACMLVALVSRRRLRVPAALVAWFAFLSWVLLSGLQLTSSNKIMVFSYRLLLYAAAALLFMYIYNLPRSARLDHKILNYLTFFWIFVIILGYADIAAGTHTLTPPFEHFIPHGYRNKEFVQELVHIYFSQVQTFLGFPVPRPAAPFTYTNLWGAAVAVLTPIALATAAIAGPGLRRRLILAVLCASVVPMVVSLNRGMFLSLGVGVFYVALRLALRGRVASLAVVLTLVGVAVAIVVLTPLGHLVSSSFSSTHGNSNTTRLSLYSDATAGANQSPLLGKGAPQQLAGQTSSPPIGTQGQLWMMLYSNGYPATIFFLVFVLGALWQTRRVPTTAGLWLHAVPLVALVQIPVYGWLPAEVFLVMAASAMAYRFCSRHPRAEDHLLLSPGVTEPGEGAGCALKAPVPVSVPP